MQTPAAARWTAILDRHEASGQTIAAFAEANDLNPRQGVRTTNRVHRPRTLRR